MKPLMPDAAARGIAEGQSNRRRSGKMRRSSEFREALAGGRRWVGKRVVVYVVPRDQGLRAGFICGRGIGNAVIRNRARRLLKEAWRSLEPDTTPGHDVMFVARPEIRGAGMREVETDMRSVLAAARVIRE